MTEDRDSDEDWYQSFWEEIYHSAPKDVYSQREAAKAHIRDAPQPELIMRIAEEASMRLEEIRERRIRSEQRLSTLFLTASITSAILLFVVSGEFRIGFTESPLLGLAYVAVSALLIIFAFGAAVGIARWALFDILRMRDGLGR